MMQDHVTIFPYKREKVKFIFTSNFNPLLITGTHKMDLNSYDYFHCFLSMGRVKFSLGHGRR